MTDQHHWEWNDEHGVRGNVREAVALFSNEADMQAAVDDLETHGFSTAAVSRPARPDLVEEALHHTVKNVADLEDDSHVPRQEVADPDSRVEGYIVVTLIPVYIALLVAAGVVAANGFTIWEGIVISILLGGLGLMTGGFLTYLMVSRKVKRIRLEKEWGGLLLWVRTGSVEQEEKAVDILGRHCGKDVHLHGPAHTPV